jgi:hypothetical protein
MVSQPSIVSNLAPPPSFSYTDGSELPLSPDELLHKHEVQKWLPVLKCMVRRMLRNDFPADFLPWVPDEH